MTRVTAILLVLLIAGAAGAGLDSGTNSIGLYFDPAAGTNEFDVGASEPFFAYIILSNPDFPELSGFEMSFNVVTPPGMEGLFYRLSENLYGGLNVAQGGTATVGQYVVGWGEPRPTSAVTPLADWQCMLLNPMTVEIYFGPSEPQSLPDGWPALEIGGVIIPAYLSSGSPGSPVAVINGTGPVAVETAAFGEVKALFR
jgi:hypothetical protein